ncbi:NUDIX domain-containing protein [Halioxenophilus sp. WMMB6]|uniref:NUDIX domain-containing protein n=1 Tax=Halioxenophilus sp. WMMB6 TaxID=3073815 RepID=UPI00295EE074|nr:NUDIX domain-containing protein [Halioxenophilus sp. WMMB6]
MQHRIRAAGILVRGETILLVHHIDGNSEYWIPPGGGFEAGDGSTRETVRREIFEETNLQAEIGELVYVREFYEPIKDTYHVELFYWVENWKGELSTDNLAGLGGDEHLIQTVRWVHRSELEHLKIYPDELLDDVWLLASAPIRNARHLGSFR